MIANLIYIKPKWNKKFSFHCLRFFYRLKKNTFAKLITKVQVFRFCTSPRFEGFNLNKIISCVFSEKCFHSPTKLCDNFWNFVHFYFCLQTGTSKSRHIFSPSPWNNFTDNLRWWIPTSHKVGYSSSSLANFTLGIVGTSWLSEHWTMTSHQAQSKRSHSSCCTLGFIVNTVHTYCSTLV